MPSPEEEDAMMSPPTMTTSTLNKSGDKKKKKKHKDKKSDRKKSKRRRSEGEGRENADQPRTSGVEDIAVEGAGEVDGVVEKSKDLPETTAAAPTTTDGTAMESTKMKRRRRSRSSSGDDNTAKKNATATVGTISVQPPSSSDPIVVSFPSGVPSPLLERESKTSAATTDNAAETSHNNGDNTGNNNADNAGNGGAGADIPTFTWHRPRPTAKRGAILNGKDATCTYASSCSGRGHDGRLTKLLVGLYDKSTGKLVLRQSAERGTVFALSQSVTSYEPAAGSGAGSAALSNMSITDRRRVLFESFGSSKKQKVLKSQAANVVSVDSVVGGESGMMGGLARQGGTISASNRMMLAGEGEDGEDGDKMDAVAAAYAEARRNFLPPFDVNATDPHRVYDAAEMAGEDAWNQISRVVDAVLRKQESDEGVDWKEALTSKGHWPPSIKSLFDGVRLDRKGAKHRIKVVLFLKHCVKFHSKCHKNFLSGTEDELTRYVGVPPAVAARLFDIFATPVTGGHGGGGGGYGDRKGGGDGYAINKQLKDKRLVHILLLYLLAHGREMKVGSINGLCKELKLELNDAANLLREAGCVAKKSAATGMMSVSLSVPLTFPPPKRGRKTG